MPTNLIANNLKDNGVQVRVLCEDLRKEQSPVPGSQANMCCGISSPFLSLQFHFPRSMNLKNCQSFLSWNLKTFKLFSLQLSEIEENGAPLLTMSPKHPLSRKAFMTMICPSSTDTGAIHSLTLIDLRGRSSSSMLTIA